jgi:hypothetical protein
MQEATGSGGQRARVVQHATQARVRSNRGCLKRRMGPVACGGEDLVGVARLSWCGWYRTARSRGKSRRGVSVDWGGHFDGWARAVGERGGLLASRPALACE